MAKENKNKMSEVNVEKAFDMWTGKSPKTEMTAEANPAEAVDGANEAAEQYEDIEPVSVSIPSLPFEVKEGDELDLNAVVKSVGNNGIEIEINKAFSKV